MLERAARGDAGASTHAKVSWQTDLYGRGDILERKKQKLIVRNFMYFLILKKLAD